MSTDQHPTDEHVLDELLASPTADEATAGRLHDLLATRAQHEGLLDVAYRTVDSPVGPLLLAATSAGLVRVAFDREGHDDVLARLATDVSPRIMLAPERLDGVALQLDEYFTGRRHRFDVAVDLQLVHGFRRTVIKCLTAIGYGTTTSYAAIAVAAGSPAAVRAVGSACAHNPVPLVVPCHRVVRSDGTIGQYLGGSEAKAALLALEAA